MYPRILKKQKHFNCKSVHFLTTLAKLSQIPKEISLKQQEKSDSLQRGEHQYNQAVVIRSHWWQKAEE